MEARRLHEQVGEAEALRAHLGLPPLSISVLVTGAPDQQARIMAAVADIDAIRAGLGLAAATVVDLRPR